MSKPRPRGGSPDIPDEDLARRVADGNPVAFEALMRRHNRTMFRTARAILHDDAEAEDALQEAYLQAYRTIGSFRGEAKFSTWMARVVANQALARLRKQVRRAAIVPLQAGAEIDEVHPTMEVSMDKGPEAAALLAAISCGAVFMGANTYIGNGPNFMVKAIAEESGIKMPSFFGYMAYSGLILLPIFGIVTLVFFA